jgi:hypothetical protein
MYITSQEFETAILIADTIQGTIAITRPVEDRVEGFFRGGDNRKPIQDDTEYERNDPLITFWETVGIIASMLDRRARLYSDLDLIHKDKARSIMKVLVDYSQMTELQLDFFFKNAPLERVNGARALAGRFINETMVIEAQELCLKRAS